MSYDPNMIFETINIPSNDLINHSGNFMPSKFYGIESSTFGNSRKNPFFKLKEIAINPTIPIEDRMRAVRYLDKIPHKDKLEHVVHACKTILDCEDCPIGQRYFFMSNNDETIKLSDHVVKACHIYFYTRSKEMKYPLQFSLLSAQYIYLYGIKTETIWNDVREFISKLALDQQETVHMRAEAADILSRKIDPLDAIIGNFVIKELGNLYVTNKMTSIYTNAENAHDETITESVMKVIRTLLVERTMKSKEEKDIVTFTGDAMQIKQDQNTGDIYEKLITLTSSLDDTKKTKIFTAFNRIIIYPAKYEGITVNDILCLVWNKICTQSADVKKELEQRLLQELSDTDALCGTGIVTRLVNILSGYVHDEGLQIKISISDQLRANIFARLQKNLQLLPQKDQATILVEIIDNLSKKDTAMEYISTYSLYKELSDEFVTPKHIDASKFDTIYNKSMCDFLGVNEVDEKIYK